MVEIVNGLCDAMSRDKWQSWLDGNAPKVHLINQLVAHFVCRVPITRQQLVPGSAGTVTWQDRGSENDGIAYIGEPGTHPSLHGSMHAVLATIVAHTHLLSRT